MDWLDLLAVQGTLNSLLQHHSSKAPILQLSAFLMIQLSHLYTTTGIDHMDLCWQSDLSAFRAKIYPFPYFSQGETDAQMSLVA